MLPFRRKPLMDWIGSLWIEWKGPKKKGCPRLRHPIFPKRVDWRGSSPLPPGRYLGRDEDGHAQCSTQDGGQPQGKPKVPLHRLSCAAPASRANTIVFISRRPPSAIVPPTAAT